MNPFQNPFRWTRGHQLVWLGISVLGAVMGVLLDFIHSPFFSLSQSGQTFISWLSSPTEKWRWALDGFLITGVIFYAAQLFRRSN